MQYKKLLKLDDSLFINRIFNDISGRYSCILAAIYLKQKFNSVDVVIKAHPFETFTDDQLLILDNFQIKVDTGSNFHEIASKSHVLIGSGCTTSTDSYINDYKYIDCKNFSMVHLILIQIFPNILHILARTFANLFIAYVR